jgi:hypothetical protein
MYSWPAPPPDTLGRFAKACSTAPSRLGIAAGFADKACGEPLGIVQQHLQEMVRRKLLVALAQSQALRRLNEAASAVRKHLDIHGPSSAHLSAPMARTGTFYVRMIVAPPTSHWQWAASSGNLSNT